MANNSNQQKKAMRQFSSAICFAAALTASLAGQVNMAQAADYLAGPEDYRSYLSRLEPGDRLQLKPGDYYNGLPLHGIQGQKNRPIIVEGPDTGDRARIFARPGSNTVSLVNVQFITIRNLELDGRNHPVDAVKAEGHGDFAHFVTLENLHIHDYAASQQNVGISTKSPAYGWVIRSNVIERVGTGIYLGNSDGTDPFVGGVIEQNFILDTLGYNLQIKHQKVRSADNYMGKEIHDTIIRDNFFGKTAKSSVDKWARPNVLLGHWPLQGEGSEDRYLVYRNVFVNNPTEALLQAEGRVSLFNNIFINAFGDAVNIRPHNDIPRDMEIFYNTILASGAGIRISEPSMQDAGFTQRVSGNVISAAHPLQARNAEHNLLMPYQPDLVVMDRLQSLTANLTKRSRIRKDLPSNLIHRYEAYPEWDREGSGNRRDVLMPGAAISRMLVDRILSVDKTNPFKR